MVLVIIICITPTVQAQETEESKHGYSFSISPQLGIITGHAEEIVLPTNTKAKYLSQLLWNMKPVFYYGFLLNFSGSEQREKRGYFADISLKQGIPGFSGIHENRDWMSMENNRLTHYSIHSNETRELFFLDLSGGLSFPFNNMVLKAYANVSFMRFSFSGSGGHGTYALEDPSSTGKYYPMSYNPLEVDYSGITVISYTQQWLNFAPGVSLDYFFDDNFFAEISFLITPFVLCADMDEHKTTDTQFRDFMKGGIYIEPGARLSHAINKWVDLSLDFSWRFITGTKGVTYQRRPIGAGNYVSFGQAGAGLSIIKIGLSCLIKL